jgi:hypothetical protein
MYISKKSGVTMGAQRRVRRTRRHRSIACGADVRAPVTEVAPASPDAEARIITLRGGERWLVTVVARLVSEDTRVGVEKARLVLRFESLARPYRPVRVATVRARELHAVDEEVLRVLATVPATHMRYERIRRWREGGKRRSEGGR